MKIRNWKRFQHFKDRKPPWIKLHRDILEQRDINVISDCAYRVLIGCWLLASEDPKIEGNLPSVDDIAFRLRIEKPKVIKALQELKSFLYQDDINVISVRYQDDTPETYKQETYKQEGEGEKIVGRAEKKRDRHTITTDDEFLQSLKSNPAYTHVDIDAEMGKMDAWLSARPGRKKTRRFIVRWLNRVEKPMEGGNNGKSRRKSVVDEFFEGIRASHGIGVNAGQNTEGFEIVRDFLPAPKDNP